MNSSDRMIRLGIALIGLAGLGLWGYRVLKKRLITHRTYDFQPQAARIHLAEIVFKSLLKPEFWNFQQQFWHYPVVPAVNGGFLSIRQIFHFKEKNKLFIGSKNNLWVRCFVSKGVAVLDRSQQHFSDLFQLLPNLVDLDLLETLNPYLPRTEHGLLETILAKINQQTKHNRDIPALLLCTERNFEQKVFVLDMLDLPKMNAINKNLYHTLVLIVSKPFFYELVYSQVQHSQRLMIYRLFSQLLDIALLSENNKKILLSGFLETVFKKYDG